MYAPIPNVRADSRPPRFETLWLEPLDTDDPGAIACVTSQGNISRREFRARVDALAVSLANSPRAALLACTNTFNFALGFCALLRAGREILLPANLQIETLADTAFANTDRLDDAAISRERPFAQLLPAAFDPAQPITLFTSGSTGTPKRVEKKMRQLSAEIETLEAHFGGLIGDAAVTATVPHIHIYGMLFRVLWPLAAGRMFHAEPVLGSNLPCTRDCTLVSSPAFLRRLDLADLALAKPRVIFSSGGQLPDAEAAMLAHTAGCPLIEVYGSTETGGVAWREWHSRTDDNSGLWTPFNDVTTRIGDTDSRLHVRSGATGDVWLDSGDIATAQSDRRFALHGRADGIIKIEDKRVSLTAVNNWLEAHEWITEVRVIELPGRRGQLGAIVRLTTGGCEQLAKLGRIALSRALRAYVQTRFEAVVAPRRWRYVAELPVNAMGKTTVMDLAKLFGRSAS